MEYIFNILLYIHIVAGSISLLAGTINVARRKGDRTHRVIGKYFFCGMITAGLSSLILSLLHPNYFLFIIGIFTLYMTISGKRYLLIGKLIDSEKPKIHLIDWSISYLMFLFGIIFFTFGIYYLAKGILFGLASILFGFIGMRFVIKDLKNFRGENNNNNLWLIAHIQRMLGAYTASLTAFMVVNIKFLPPILVWILPTIIIVPLINAWTRKITSE